MLLKLTQGCSILLASVMLVSCASGPTQFSSGDAKYYDAAFDDKNRAPSSMSPPVVKDGVVDPTHMRTQADYHFAMGEAFSLDSNHAKAVEAFKSVLIYDSEAPQVHLRLASEYVKMGMLTEALEHTEIAIKKQPKLVDAHLLLGGLYSTLKAYDKAIGEYETVLKIEPKNIEAPLYMGAVFAEKKQYEKAVKCFEGLTKNDEYPNTHLAYYYIGRVRSEQQGQAFQKAAEKAYTKALELKPTHFESLMALGELYDKMGKPEKAMKLYSSFQREHGPNYRLAELLAQTYIEQEKYDLAFEQLEMIETSGEDSLNVKVRIALILIEQKKYDQAIARLKEVLKQVPESDKIRFYLAAIYEEVNKPSEAIEHFMKIPAGSQFYGEAMVHAAYLLKQTRKLDEALSVAKEGIENRPDIAQLYAIKASILDEKGSFKEAATLLERGTEKFPDNVQLRFFLGTVHDRLGNKQKVEASMKAVLDMDPNHVQGLNYLAFTYAESNSNLEEAEKLVRRALEFEPHDGFILDTLGWILYKKGQFGDAVKVLEHAHRSQPNEAVIAEHLGDAYSKKQLNDQARKMYQKAAEVESDESKVKLIRAKITALEKQELQYGNRQPASTP